MVRHLRAAMYRRRAKKAIAFLRHLDTLAKMAGWNRGMVRTMWRDLVEHPSFRSAALDKLASVSRIKIKRERRTRLQKSMAILYNKYVRAASELELLRGAGPELPIELVAELVAYGVDTGWLNTELEEYGITIAEEEKDEVPAVQP